jgi:hypothetical protein
MIKGARALAALVVVLGGMYAAQHVIARQFGERACDTREQHGAERSALCNPSTASVVTVTCETVRVYVVRKAADGSWIVRRAPAIEQAPVPDVWGAAWQELMADRMAQ